MSQKGINRLIISSPYEEPKEHWLYIRETQEFVLQPGRRQSGYWRATAKTAHNFDDPGEFVSIELVNKIRPRVKQMSFVISSGQDRNPPLGLRGGREGFIIVERIKNNLPHPFLEGGDYYGLT